MHPDLLLDYALQRTLEARAVAMRRRLVHRRPRPPQRHVRRVIAAGLVRLAARIADEPVNASPRRA